MVQEWEDGVFKVAKDIVGAGGVKGIGRECSGMARIAGIGC